MDTSEVWPRVRKFAERCAEDQVPLYTLQRRVRNFITDVTSESIGRRSDDGTTNASRVTRNEVERFWAELNGGSPADVLVFTKALMVAALPDVLESVHGFVHLRRARRIENNFVRVCADNGLEVDASFQIEDADGALAIVIGAGGGRRDDPESVNTEYATGLRIVLLRLRTLHASLLKVVLDSSVVVRKLSEEERTLRIEGVTYPVMLQEVEDVEDLRRRIGRAAAATGREPDAKGGGNREKRLRLFVSVANTSRDELVALLRKSVTIESDFPDPRSASTRTPPAGASQGFIADPLLRKCLEQYGMLLAQQHFENQHYLVDPDVHLSNPFDLRCERADGVLFVEVKATTTTGDAVFLTNGEVEFARANKGRMALFLVHSILVQGTGEDLRVSGGETVVLSPWDVDAGILVPVSHRWTRPK